MSISKEIFARFIVLSVLVAMVPFAGCSKKQQAEEDPTVPTAPAVEDTVLGDSDSGKALGLQTINFPYDSFVLDGQAKAALKANAQIMNDKSSLKVQIEGHCDQRGGIQYNIALGEKRANSVRNYMTDLGVTADRITTISYGKERPIDPGMTEEAFGKNRRANFVITSR
ncbi:MAG: hypothetical protein A2583_16765 [Bdellovibrionales bacterium RIFOXYD1_FULL_53_11]|nr:MAG: hypothetical protein A2583_16765 [Bdellovibrionales bacterium RIFOXYD1_FULL_53_11]